MLGIVDFAFFFLLQRAAISFHDNHGANIVLSNDNQTAEYAQGYGDGVVMLRDPMEVNMLYEVFQSFLVDKVEVHKGKFYSAIAIQWVRCRGCVI